MTQEERFEKILAYLSGDLCEAEQQHFEKMLKAEPELASDMQMCEIEQYLLSELTSVRLVDFLRRLKEDKELQKEVAFQQKALMLVQKAAREQINTEIGNRSEAEWDNRSPSAAKKSTSMLIILPVFLFTVMGLFMVFGKLFKPLPPSDQEVYRKYFRPFAEDGLVSLAGLSFKESALQQYKKGNYRKALTMFNQLLEERPDNCTYRFYTAMCLLVEGDASKAAFHFDKLLSDNKPKYDSASEWYMGLAYLRSVGHNKGKPVFERIADNDYHPYQQTASRIIKNWY